MFCKKKRYNTKEIEFLNYLKISNTKYNRQKYNFKDYNEKCKKTFGELYDKTMKKFISLNKLGYSIYYMWENDWNRWLKNKSNTFPLKKFIKYE